MKNQQLPGSSNRGKGLFPLFLSVVVSILLLILNSESKLEIHQRAYSTVFYPVQYVVDRVTSFKDWFISTEEMKKEVETLSVEIRVLKEEKRKLDSLSSELKILQEKQLFRWNVVARALYQKDSLIDTLLHAKVVSSDMGLNNVTLVIDAGSQDSLKENMPVFSGKSVIGRTARVMYAHTHVQLITDPAMKLSIMEQRTHSLGVFESIDVGAYFAVFPGYAEISKGDTIITSGYGGIFPKGIPVGVVKGFLEAPEKGLLKVNIELLRNPNSVEDAFVLKRTSNWLVKD